MDGDQVHFVTQTDVVRFLKWLLFPEQESTEEADDWAREARQWMRARPQDWHAIAHHTIRELGLLQPTSSTISNNGDHKQHGSTHVYSVYNHTALSDCLALMARHQLRSVPIVDTLCGRIMGTLSVTDLLGPLAERYMSAKDGQPQQGAQDASEQQPSFDGTTAVGDLVRQLKHRPVYGALPPDRVCTGIYLLC